MCLNISVSTEKRTNNGVKIHKTENVKVNTSTDIIENHKIDQHVSNNITFTCHIHSNMLHEYAYPKKYWHDLRKKI